LESDTRSVNLIEDRKKYFENRIFKERVKIDFRLLDSKNIIEDLYEMINKHKNKKILVEFISKKSAYDFYSYLIERKELGELEFDIRLLTGDDNTIERENILNEIRTLNNILLISTQVIEAGVDIDMDIGFKSISIFDSEEQFLGRINRSCLKENSLVYFFKLDDIKGIYKEDVRSHEDLTIENKNIRQCLIDKSFTSYYEEVLKRLKKTQKSLVN
ncbi:CRISPR-associated helicase/endonuclease Cas3, partial [Clostridium chauvoei]